MGTVKESASSAGEQSSFTTTAQIRNSSENEGPNRAGEPHVIDTTFLDRTSSTDANTSQIPRQEFYTADMAPSILNNLFGQALKVLHVAAAFSPAAFVKNPGALKGGSGSGMSLNGLKGFLLKQHQKRRAGSMENPTTSSVPVVNRQFLEGHGGKIGGGTRGKKVQMLRVQHARQDAEMYKQSVSQLWTDYFTVRPTSMSGWNSIIEERIAMARRDGQFDNLQGRGKPIDLASDDRKNPFITPTEFFMHRMIKAQGYVPPWIELGKDIEDDIAKLRKEMRDIWAQCRRIGGLTGEDEYFERRGQRWAEIRCKEINEKIRRFNIEAPRGIPQKTRMVVDEVVDCPASPGCRERRENRRTAV
ncbi:hypothetical protein BC832DRAFT_335298 [Gaertneriomyces semiglobifer]|nr:hypothetical protein BC832DRAFT_335298 [Gaertneriomyces semiglobifer]